MNIEKTVKALKDKGYEVFRVKTGKEALIKIKKMIPKGKSVMNGSSVTLEQIGYIDHLKSGKSGWDNLHAKVFSEKDPKKQKKLRKLATISDYYLGSVHALLTNGEFLVASNSGSQMPSIVFNSQNLIFVVSTKKIVPDFEGGMKRITDYIVPLEEKHMQSLYGIGTSLSKILYFKKENFMSGRKIIFILVDEDLGY